MSDLLGLATIALAGITLSTLQLSLGGLILIYHSSLGNYRRKKSRFLASSYIFGAFSIIFLLSCTSSFFVQNLWIDGMPTFLIMVMLGILFASAIIMWTIYYRKGNGTKIWLPSTVINYFTRRSEGVSDGIEAYSLGVLSGILELPLGLAIYALIGNTILGFDGNYKILAALLFAIMTTLPLWIIRAITRRRTAMTVQKWRLDNKGFLKFISGFAYLALCVFIAAFWIIK